MSTRNDILNNLLDALAVMKDDATYECHIRQIVPFRENALDKLRGDLPMLMVLDTGNEQILCEDSTHWRFAFDVEIQGFVIGDSSLDTQQRLNEILAGLQRFVNSDPDLGSAVLAIDYTEGLPHLFDAANNRAVTGARMRIHYVREKPVSEAAGSSVYGTGYIETAKDKVVALCTTLLTTMAAYDPTFTSVHDHHNVANLALNAVTVDCDSTDPEIEAVGSAGLSVEYPCILTIRVHTGYVGTFVDTNQAAALVCGVANYLQEHKALGDNYRMLQINQITINNFFEESQTYGGQISAVVNTYIRHEQG